MRSVQRKDTSKSNGLHLISQIHPLSLSLPINAASCASSAIKYPEILRKILLFLSKAGVHRKKIELMMMRTPMAKLRALLLISLLLCSSLSALTARPNPPSYSGVPHKLHHQDVGADEEAELEPASCEGVEERCLMRKTLNAHIDYIYTQHHKP